MLRALKLTKGFSHVEKPISFVEKLLFDGGETQVPGGSVLEADSGSPLFWLLTCFPGVFAVILQLLLSSAAASCSGAGSTYGRFSFDRRQLTSR